ncbi:PA0069 family radical SAM protein [Aquabacterium sp. A7-Y]|uniref:PA0069 family radical SAM protein n=1 Tax=Aquabacterium sp. A7-Y TaxID=1349605 RepID=UPI00223CDE42|nr:PA0069 family radical SAM protein [Aquabacterium sp. A7-Y]MCW7537736.1 PA0069 family radical SAM protein [Aquabacterium sp. A7-Y]
MPSDPLLPGAFKGRGTALRIAHRFERAEREGFDDGWGTLEQDAREEHLPPATTIIEERVKSLLAANDSPDIPFELSINPYRGCEHGCIYCYARPTHSYLNLSPGLDFETRIVAKVNAAERLEEELARPRYRPSPINIGSATDAYQPVERKLGLTRQVLEVLTRCAHPFTIISKSSGVERDLDLIAPAAQAGRAWVSISITTLDGVLCRIMEPRAASPLRRLETVRRLSAAGVPVGVNIAPIIPFLNEPEIERLVEAAADAGAGSIHYTVLRLPWEVNPLFHQWLEQHFPERAGRVMARVREMRGGQDYKADFGSRMKGTGLWAELIRQRIDKAVTRCGLTRQVKALDAGVFRPPQKDGQGVLF